MASTDDIRPSRLLALPRELRDMIYDYTFASYEVKCHHRTAGQLNTGLLRANKQLRDETRLLYYSKTTFSFVNERPLLRWLGELPTDALEALTQVILRLTYVCWGFPGSKEYIDFRAEEDMLYSVPEAEKLGMSEAGKVVDVLYKVVVPDDLRKEMVAMGKVSTHEYE